MGLWAKSVVIFNAIREHGKQSVRRLADRTGLSKSSVHRHLQAIDRRDHYPESSFWDTEAGRTWLSNRSGRYHAKVTEGDSPFPVF
jgi:predicted ArsR family transcriptional regulator